MTKQTMTNKQLTLLIELLASNNLEQAKELANTKQLPDLTEAQAEALANIALVDAYVFEDFYANPFTREASMLAPVSQYGEDVQGQAYDVVDASRSIGDYLNNFLASMHFGLDQQTEAYAANALELMEQCKPMLETLLVDIKDWNAKQFHLDYNKALVASKLLERTERRNKYSQLSELELTMLMMSQDDEGVKEELKAEAVRRIEAKNTPTLTNPTNTIRGDLDAMAMHYSGDLGGQRHAADAQSVKPFNNREMVVPVIGECNE